MSDFKMHEIRFPLGLRPRPRWGAYSASLDFLAVGRLLLRGGRGNRKGKGRGRERGGEGEGRRKGEGEGKGFAGPISNCLLCACLRQTVHTHRASVHQAAKLIAALFRVARVTAGMAESNGRFMTHVSCRLTAMNRGQIWNPTLGNRVWASFTFYM